VGRPGRILLLHVVGVNQKIGIVLRGWSTPKPADKLVYIFVALESMLLRNSNEPLGKNIGERMAFLIGNSLESRKAVVANVDAIYEIRSSFLHHGEHVEDLEVFSTFMLNAWTCFTVLLENANRYQTRDQLIAALEDRKLA
jgi:hypothetical protein